MKWEMKMRDWGYSEPDIPEKDRVKCPTCEGCGFEEDENYEHSTCSVCLGMGYIAK